MMICKIVVDYGINWKFVVEKMLLLLYNSFIHMN